MKAIGRLQKLNYFIEPFAPLKATYKTTVNTNQQGHNTKTTATAGNYALILFGIIVINMNSFPRHTTIGFCPFPEVLKRLFLHLCKQLLILGRKLGIAICRFLRIGTTDH